MRGGAWAPDWRAPTRGGAFQQTGSTCSPGVDTPISWPRLRPHGASNAVSHGARSAGTPKFRSPAALHVGGHVGAGGARSAGDVPIALLQPPARSLFRGVPATGGPETPRQAAYRADVPMCVPVGRDIRTSEHRNFGSEPSRATPRGHGKGAAEQRPFAHLRSRAPHPAPSHRDRLADCLRQSVTEDPNDGVGVSGSVATGPAAAS